MSAPARKRKGRAPEGDPALITPPSDNDQFNGHRRQNGYAAPTAPDRREAALLAELHALGYGITVPCLICARPLTSKRSLLLHVGPTCFARMAVAR